MIVGGHHQDALPSTRANEPRRFVRLFSGVIRPVRKLHNRRGGHAKRLQVVFHYVRQAHVLAQHPAARHNDGRYSFTVQFRRVKSAIRGVIVVTENNQRIGWRGRLVHHPKLSGEPQQRVPEEVEEQEKPGEKQQE